MSRDLDLDLNDDERTFFSIIGAIRFDAAAVAKTLRARRLTGLEAAGLANLLEGKHPQGLRLEMRGQGKGWTPSAEGAAAYDRLVGVGRFVDAEIANGSGVEDAVIDASEEFGISVPTVYRDLKLYRLIDKDDD